MHFLSAQPRPPRTKSNHAVFPLLAGQHRADISQIYWQTSMTVRWIEHYQEPTMQNKRNWNKGLHRLWLVYCVICVLFFMFGLGQTALECERAAGGGPWADFLEELYPRCSPWETLISQPRLSVGSF